MADRLNRDVGRRRVIQRAPYDDMDIDPATIRAKRRSRMRAAARSHIQEFFAAEPEIANDYSDIEIEDPLADEYHRWVMSGH